MRYEFYDREGNLLGVRRNPEGKAINRDEEITLHVEGQTVSQWKAIAVSGVENGVQKVAVRLSFSGNGGGS